MSNITEYKDIVAFHPGYYIADIIEDMEISQAEFAARLGKVVAESRPTNDLVDMVFNEKSSTIKSKQETNNNVNSLDFPPSPL